MAAKSGHKLLTKVDWAHLLRRHEAGETAREIAESKGLSFDYVRKKLRACKAMSPEERASLHAAALHRQLVAAETALFAGEVAEATRLIRALNALAVATQAVEDMMPDDRGKYPEAGEEEAGEDDGAWVESRLLQMASASAGTEGPLEHKGLCGEPAAVGPRMAALCVGGVVARREPDSAHDP